MTGALGLVGSFIIVPFITFFLLNDYHRIQKAIIENVPNKYFEMSLNVIYKLEQQLSKYIRGVCIELISVAVLYIGAYSILGFRYADNFWHRMRFFEYYSDGGPVDCGRPDHCCVADSIRRLSNAAPDRSHNIYRSTNRPDVYPAKRLRKNPGYASV